MEQTTFKCKHCETPTLLVYESCHIKGVCEWCVNQHYGHSQVADKIVPLENATKLYSTVEAKDPIDLIHEDDDPTLYGFVWDISTRKYVKGQQCVS